MAMKQKYLTVSETARRLDLSSQTVRRYEQTGLLEAIRVGKGQRLFDRAAVERFAQARAQKDQGVSA